MAAYLKQADQVVLILSKAEANALFHLAEIGQIKDGQRAVNGATREVRDRAFRAISTATTPGSRSGARIE